MRLRAGIIGCGWSGSRFNEGRRRAASIFAHAAAYSRLRGVGLASVADCDPARLLRCRAAWGVSSAYPDYREMLRTEPLDIVSICTPDDLHHEVALQVLAISHVRGILCEKPLAATLAQAREIFCLAERRGVKLGVNYTRRYAQGYQKVARLLRAGRLGRLQGVHGYYSGGLVHNGTHLLDVLTWFFGRPIEVRALNGPRGKLADEGIGAVLHFPDGGLAVVQGVAAERFPLFEIDILGAEGRITISRDGELIRHYAVRQSRHGFDRRALAQRPEVIARRLQDPTLCAIRDLVDSLGSARQPKCSPRDGVSALAVAEAIVRSVHTGGSVKVEDVDV